MNTPSRPKCQKIHRIRFIKPIRVMKSEGDVVRSAVIQGNTVLSARLEAAVSPQHLTEVANIYCEDGQVYFGVPYSRFRFCED